MYVHVCRGVVVGQIRERHLKVESRNESVTSDCKPDVTVTGSDRLQTKRSVRL